MTSTSHVKNKVLQYCTVQYLLVCGVSNQQMGLDISSGAFRQRWRSASAERHPTLAELAAVGGVRITRWAYGRPSAGWVRSIQWCTAKVQSRNIGLESSNSTAIKAGWWSSGSSTNNGIYQVYVTADFDVRPKDGENGR